MVTLTGSGRYGDVELTLDTQTRQSADDPRIYTVRLVVAGATVANEGFEVGDYSGHEQFLTLARDIKQWLNPSEVQRPHQPAFARGGIINLAVWTSRRATLECQLLLWDRDLSSWQSGRAEAFTSWRFGTTKEQLEAFGSTLEDLASRSKEIDDQLLAASLEGDTASGEELAVPEKIHDDRLLQQLQRIQRNLGLHRKGQRSTNAILRQLLMEKLSESDPVLLAKALSTRSLEDLYTRQIFSPSTLEESGAFLAWMLTVTDPILLENLTTDQVATDLQVATELEAGKIGLE